MILSAMMFALGAFVTGLLALAFCVALVRRTRRVTERRLVAAVSARRAEFDAERDELRARHAVQIHRLEREIARVLDMATAHRLDADVKDRDLLNIKAELEAGREEIRELQERLEEQRTALQESERKYAESSTALRAARHALKLESRRRAAMEDPLDTAIAVADEKQIELTALRTQVEALRMALAQTSASIGQPASSTVREDQSDTPAHASSVIPLPLRARAKKSPNPSTGWNATIEPVEEGSNQLGTGMMLHEAPAAGAAAERQAEKETEEFPSSGQAMSNAAEAPDIAENAETVFVEALAEIRALKRAATSHAAE